MSGDTVDNINNAALNGAHQAIDQAIRRRAILDILCRALLDGHTEDDIRAGAADPDLAALGLPTFTTDGAQP